MFSNSYQLPDGTSVGLPNKDLETCYEVIFQPTLSNDSRIADSKSLPNAIVDSINDCAIDSRRSLINNVILAGGMSSAIGMNERLKAELKLSPTGFSSSDIRIRNSGVGVEGVSNAVWRGGSIITSLSIFDERWITSRDYDEYGPTIVHKMCPTYL
jgi:actin-related protein